MAQVSHNMPMYKKSKTYNLKKKTLRTEFYRTKNYQIFIRVCPNALERTMGYKNTRAKHIWSVTIAHLLHCHLLV